MLNLDDLFMDYTLMFSERERKHIAKLAAERNKRSKPIILIVEDQPFSRKLLTQALAPQYSCHSAATVREAVALYAEYVPNIVFLDIELPDLDGHQFADFIRKEDPTSYIIMLTANSSSKDVQLARGNHVQGYIVKPYSKQKILDTIEAYNRSRR